MSNPLQNCLQVKALINQFVAGMCPQPFADNQPESSNSTQEEDQSRSIDSQDQKVEEFKKSVVLDFSNVFKKKLPEPKKKPQFAYIKKSQENKENDNEAVNKTVDYGRAAKQPKQSNSSEWPLLADFAPPHPASHTPLSNSNLIHANPPLTPRPKARLAARGERHKI